MIRNINTVSFELSLENYEITSLEIALYLLLLIFISGAMLSTNYSRQK